MQRRNALRKTSWLFGKVRKRKHNSNAFRKTPGLMTTASRIFSRRHTHILYQFRSLPIFADYSRNLPKTIWPLLRSLPSTLCETVYSAYLHFKVSTRRWRLNSSENIAIIRMYSRIMTTSIGIHPTFSGMQFNYFILSYLYCLINRVIVDIVEVHACTDIAWSPLNICHISTFFFNFLVSLWLMNI